MNEASTEPRRAQRKRRRAHLSPLTVIGELLLIGGVATLGYLVWQPWYTTTVVAGQNAAIADELSAQWRAHPAPPPADPGVVPITAVVPEGEAFGVLRVPAFGRDFAYRLAEGTSMSQVLNDPELGIGRYTETQMPGQPGGNVGFAAHRSGPATTPFRDIMNLRIGDPLFIETVDGWYTYRFRDIEYVLPSAGEVLSPFPWLDGVAGEDQILTLTTCHPKLSGNTERAISYAVLESFQPAADGVPAEYTELISQGA